MGISAACLKKQFHILILSLLFIPFAYPSALGRVLSPQDKRAAVCSELADSCPDARISEIRIIHHPIFELQDNMPGWFPETLANRLHIDTAEDVIRRELLFKEGQAMDPERIAETLRNLRALGYFRDEQITCRLIAPGKVGITVSLKENWSISPILDSQGRDLDLAVTIGMREQNLLGRGKHLSFSYRNGTQKGNTIYDEYWRIYYLDPNILGSRYSLSWTLQALEDGEYLASGVAHPYYTLDTPWMASLTNSHYRRQRRLILDGNILAEYEQEDNANRVEFGLTLKGGPPVVHRLHAFYEYKQNETRDFSLPEMVTLLQAINIPAYLTLMPLEFPTSTATKILEDMGVINEETLSAPGLSYRRLGIHYITEERINRFERYEDINLANDLNLSLAFSAEGLGADEDTLIFSVSDTQGHAFRKGHYFTVSAAALGESEGNRTKNTECSLSYNHYLRKTPLDLGPLAHTLHWRGTVDYGYHLDGSTYLALGYDSGLRGYERYALTGTGDALLINGSLEDRIFVTDKLFNLLAVGILLFWDFGNVWPEEEAIKAEDLYHSAGIGLRLAIPSWAVSNVLQLTWGFPLSGDYSPIDDALFTVFTGTGF